MTDALLDKTKAAILQKADPRLQQPIQAVVSAGHKIMFSPQTRKMALQEMGNAQDPESIGAAVAKLLAVLYHQSGKRLPMQVAIPAAMVLMCDVLQFLEDAGSVQVNKDFLAQVTSATGSAVLQMFGATPEQLQAFTDRGQAAQSSAPAAPQPPAASQPQGIIQGAQ